MLPISCTLLVDDDDTTNYLHRGGCSAWLLPIRYW